MNSGAGIDLSRLGFSALRFRWFAVLTLAVLLIVGACGRRGDPRPPRSATADTPRILFVARAADGIWLRPQDPTPLHWQARPAPDVCSPLDIAFERQGTTEPGMQPWYRLPMTASGSQWVRFAALDPQAVTPWYRLPPTAPVPMPQLQWSVTAGRLNVYYAPVTTVAVEVATDSKPWRWFGTRQATAVTLGPYPPETKVRLRLWGLSRNDDGWRISSQPATLSTQVR